MITLFPRAGRLAGVRLLSPVTDEEFDRFLNDVTKWVQSIQSQVIFCSDLRGAQVLTEAISARIIGSMRQDNPKLKRTALILPAHSAVLALQFERIIREAGNPARKTFRRAVDAQAWLSEVLRPAEQQSLAEFLSEWDDREIESTLPRSSVASVSSGRERPVSARQPPSKREGER